MSEISELDEEIKTVNDIIKQIDMDIKDLEETKKGNNDLKIILQERLNKLID